MPGVLCTGGNMLEIRTLNVILNGHRWLLGLLLLIPMSTLHTSDIYLLQLLYQHEEAFPSPAEMVSRCTWAALEMHEKSIGKWRMQLRHSNTHRCLLIFTHGWPCWRTSCLDACIHSMKKYIFRFVCLHFCVHMVSLYRDIVKVCSVMNVTCILIIDSSDR